jgi:HK97 family phage prohead protease
MNEMQIRSFQSELVTRSDDNSKDPIIEGYFAVFDSPYQISSNYSESIARGAFTETLKDADVRALINHDASKVLGRTKAGTLELKEDDKGLWGRIHINPNDTEAMNLYERVKRGDVSQCSFGFRIQSQETKVNENKVHWIIKQVKLFEVSACTFPAYEQTGISARQKDIEEFRKKQLDLWRNNMLAKLKGETRNAEGTDAQKEN